jgi:predicted HAD superfamily Cof-like phosphohydrolase
MIKWLKNLFKPSIDPTVEKVLEFHTKFRCVIGNTEHPQADDCTEEEKAILTEAARLMMQARHILREHCQKAPSTNCMRVALIAEETAELANALVAEDDVAVLDALLDIRYVADGTTVAYGMHEIFDEGFNRVHDSNLSKLDENGQPIFDASGKVCKGPNYKKVDLRDLFGLAQ